MFSVVIAEDEPAERDALAELLRREFSEVLELKYAAANGLFALKYIFTHKVDLVFLDVRMPVMTGIDMMREIRKTNPDIEVIVVSAYSEFEYAQQSLSLDAVDYLLKPYTTEQLGQAVQKGLERLRRRVAHEHTQKILEDQREKLRDMIDRDVISTMFYASSPPSEAEFDELATLLDLPSKMWILIVFRISEAEEPLNQEEWARLLGMYRSIRRESIVHGSGREMISVNFFVDDRTRPHFRTFAEFVQRHCQTEFHRTVAYAMTQAHVGPDRLVEAYSEATVPFTPPRTVDGSAGITFLAADFARETARILISGERQELVILRDTVLRRLQQLGRNQRAAAVRSYLTILQGELFRRLPRPVASRGVILLERLKEQMVHGDTAELHSFETGMEDLLDESNRLLGRSREAIVTRIKEFVRDHITEDLSIDRLARIEGMSPSHLSRVFRETAGVTVNQCVIRTRLDRGDELLHTQGLTLKEIASRIGIRDPNYFTKLYKKVYGKTPKRHL